MTTIITNPDNARVLKYLSPYENSEKNVERIERALNSRGPGFRDFVVDFCETFNLDVSGYGPNISVLTKSGLPGGTLGMNQDHRGAFYYYQSDFVSKDRGSSRTSRYSRDSVKSSSLIKTVMKNKEYPTDEKWFLRDLYGYRCALTSASNSWRTPDISLDQSTQLSLVKLGLGLDTSLPIAVMDNIKEAYDKFNREVAAQRSGRSIIDRFTKGCTCIAMIRGDSDGGWPAKYTVRGYAVFDLEFEVPVGSIRASESTKPKLASKMVRYNSLRDCPEIAPVLPILSSFFSTKQSNFINDIGVEYLDKYYPEVDIATGHGPNDRLNVLIPKVQPEE